MNRRGSATIETFLAGGVICLLIALGLQISAFFLAEQIVSQIAHEGLICLQHRKSFILRQHCSLMINKRMTSGVPFANVDVLKVTTVGAKPVIKVEIQMGPFQSIRTFHADDLFTGGS